MPIVRALGGDHKAVEAADADPAIRAVVFTGDAGRFSFGADIKDFATDPTPERKTVHDALAAVERSLKTSVGAIEGDAPIGGFELALTCDYRIGSKQTELGFPEINQSPFPGAGGTQAAAPGSSMHRTCCS
jgi:3-hydroxyacyl-CoA dehydrogenase